MKIVREIVEKAIEGTNSIAPEGYVIVSADELTSIIAAKLEPVKEVLIGIGSSASRGNLYHADAPDACASIAGKVQNSLAMFDEAADA